jgi:RsiW-degrading membrane proteinase PrsW (M82 family)
MASLLTACGGFLFAVLWMDLIFDVQVLRFRSAPNDLPEVVLASIAAYYHRATTTSRPMGRLIAAVMVILLGALTYQSARGHDPWWLLVLSALLAGTSTMLALTQTVPDAVRLGWRVDGPPEQTRLARSVCRDHLVCAGCMFVFVVLWVVRSAAL